MTKRLFITTFFASILSFFIGLPCSAQQYTVFENHFENWTDGKPDGWSFLGSHPDQSPNVQPQYIPTVSQYTPAYTGSYACKITATPWVVNKPTPRHFPMRFFDAPDFFPIYWGKKYVLSFAAKLIKGTSFDIIIESHNKEKFLIYHLQKNIVIGENYQEFEIEFIPELISDNTLTGKHAPHNSKSCGFSFYISAEQDYEFVIDYIKLVAKDRTMEFDYLETNNIKAYIDPIAPFLKGNGNILSDNINYFEVPKNSGKSTIFSANLWLGGLDEHANLHLAAQQYCQRGFDFWLGPITNDYTIVDEKQVVSDAFIQKYHHTWKVTKAEIEYHKTHYSDPNYVMPWGIANWPAHGRTSFGENWNLAPYKEIDGNGWYTPQGGDYPEIRGDEAVLFIMNDVLNAHTESSSMNALGLEIIGMAYAFNSGDEALQNSIFLTYYLRNKSSHSYQDFYFGFWTDFDIGYWYDDYSGCDTALNMMYGYNGRAIDGQGEPWAYGENPPAQGAMFLNQKMSTFVYVEGHTGPTGQPQTAVEYYNYLRGKWRDGLPMTLGGNGYNQQSTDYYNFMYSRIMFNEAPWCEETPNGADSQLPNPPGDRRGLMSTGPFTLSFDKCLEVDIALPFARSGGKKSLESVALLKLSAEEVQEYYDKYIAPFPFIGIKENKVYNEKLRVYPNPSNGCFTIASEKIIESIELYDIMGKKVFSEMPKKQTTQISTRLPQGLYIYRAVLEGNSVNSGKIIVQ
jgi:hypothetical protein